ncbi:Protein of unknown function, partial [Cotesia congregata]
MTPLALEFNGDIVGSWPASNYFSISSISISFLVQRLELSYPEVLANIEGFFNGNNLKPRGRLNDVLLVVETIARTSRCMKKSDTRGVRPTERYMCSS